jgi:nitrogen fixation protein NifU and related proteins
MSDLRELYQEVILDHTKRPRNFGRLEAANRRAKGHNPLCGDKLDVYLRMKDGVIDDVKFEGAGCAISTASASMMTEAVKGLTQDEALALFEGFHNLLTEESNGGGEELGKLAVFSGVREFPVRVKCATLAWHTLKSALENSRTTTSTE